MPAGRWWELDLTLPEPAAEAVTNFVWELGALGVVEEARADDPPRLRAFFPGSARPDALAAELRAYLDGLRALGLPPAGTPAIRPLTDGAWAEAWRAHFRPRPVGRTLLIAPPWEVPPADGRVVLVIEPGRAFGTGHHGTTAGCLEVLEAVIARERPRRALDLGTGSGVLAVAAARLGVAEVVAVDSDPDAVAAATANAARNGVAARVRCRLGDAGALALVPAPLVLANLLAAAHLALARRYAALVAPAGALVLGGLLDAEADQVQAALGAHGFAPAATLTREGWTTLELRRAPRGPGDATLHDRA